MEPEPCGSAIYEHRQEGCRVGRRVGQEIELLVKGHHVNVVGWGFTREFRILGKAAVEPLEARSVIPIWRKASRNAKNPRRMRRRSGVLPNLSAISTLVQRYGDMRARLAA
jgi:hypothetical protein